MPAVVVGVPVGVPQQQEAAGGREEARQAAPDRSNTLKQQTPHEAQAQTRVQARRRKLN